MDAQITAAIAEGEDAINKFLEHAARLATVISSNFPSVTLEQVAKEFAAAPVDGKALNSKVTTISNILREEAAIAAVSFRQAEMWLKLKTPSVSDGNNFGVEVQNYACTELTTMRTAMEAMTTSGKDYHWGRAAGLEKVLGDDKKETVSSKTDEDDGEKKTAKTSTKVESKSVKPEAFADYHAYLTSVDVKQYHLVFSQLTDVRNNYLKAHVLFSKNMKRLNDPRGEGEDGGSRNVMSMF